MTAATLVDSNVLIDVLAGDPRWAPWSERALELVGSEGPLVINEIVYAEVSYRYGSVEQLDIELPEDQFSREHTPWVAAFLAGKAYADYRRRGGSRTAPLPDFFIGAHAAVAGLRLLTRDPRRYRTYFPELELIHPQ